MKPNMVEMISFIKAVFSSDPPMETGLNANIMAGGGG
jgi:hypothetical protein